MIASFALTGGEKLIEDIAQDILEYFLRNPGAVDTAEGIARWRLLEEAVHRSLETTENALQWLTREGYLTEVSRREKEPVFQLNRGKVTAALELLRAKNAKPDKDRG